MGRFRCKKGSKRNPEGDRRYWNKYKRKCQRTKKAASRKPCGIGRFRQANGWCKMTNMRKGQVMYE